MQNKGAIWVFTILLAIASLYQISFSFFTSGFESKAENFAETQLDSVRAERGELSALEESELREQFADKFLRDNANEQIYPIFGYTYSESKEKEINLGLDLKGGMSVILEVSIPDLIIGLSGNSKDADFRKAINDAREMQRNSQDDFVTLFARAWQQNSPDKKMAAVFHSRDNKEKFPREADNAQIVRILRDEAEVAINNTEKILRTRIDKFGVAQPTIQKQQLSGRIIIELPGVKDKERVRKVLKSTANLEFWNTHENFEIYPVLEELNTALSRALFPDEDFDFEDDADGDEASQLVDDADDAQDDTALDVLENDTTDVDVDEEADLLSELADDTDTLITSPDDDTMSEAERRKRFPLFSLLSPNAFDGRLQNGPVVGFAMLSDTAEINKLLRHPIAREILPRDLRLLWSARPEPQMGNLMQLYAIKVDTRDGSAPLDGSTIVDASQDFDPTGQVQVLMQMNSEGAKVWKRLTANASSQSPKRSIAIVLDDYVYSAPVVQGEIPSGRSSISMGSRGTKTDQIKEADDLANLLKAGALPAPANIVDEVIVGPSLGQQNINSGLMSFLIALVVVLFYMVFYYRGAGVVSDIALIANLFFLIGALASLQASLTLPGIAGIILTIGMAVDANVLIFERVREGLRRGKGLKAAITEGYSKAYSAIIDANITTLLTAIVLLVLGSGPVKGFATTLIIGIFTSLYSAIFITRLLFAGQIEGKKNITFSSKLTANWFVNASYDFVGKRKVFYAISGVLILVSLISLTTRKLDFGVDFIGGRTYDVRFDEIVDIENVRTALADEFVGEDGLKMSPEVKTIGTANQVKITTKFLVDDTAQDADERVERALRAGLTNVSPDFEIMSSRKVDPTISDDFQKSSTLAVIFSLLIIFLYIVFRFKRWQFGLGAIVAMFHDVLIVLGIFSLFYGILPFSMEIDQAFIAAILTVVGYSINDTVVVFDRIREELFEHPKDQVGKVFNRAVNATLSRTINTSMSTFVVLLSIFIFGGESIRGFIFALMIGVVVGTYSSICVATPTVLQLWKQKLKKEKAA
ncbi:MAG: protein translocase subunit SecDF [Cryomorphaceae bacterium]|nr:MAG: protein translocase subunit SecDF [Cryomorphaceae bacterium]